MKIFFGLTAALLLSACGNEQQSLIVSKTCALDAPVANSRILAGKEINVMGWAFDKQSAGSQSKVHLLFNSLEQSKAKAFDALLDVKRPDISTAFKDPKLENSGFSLTIPANTLSPGKYEITILQERPNATLVCGDGYFVVVE